MSVTGGVEKLATKISGFDHISDGGVPLGRTTLVCGTAGSAKTVFAAQFLVEGIKQSNENGVFVTFEESAEDIRRNFLNFGWDIAKWEAENKWAFVDASPRPGEENVVVGEFDLTALMARIEYAINKVGAKRVSMDSLGAIFGQLSDEQSVRRGLFAVSGAVKRLGVTTIMTAERTDEYGAIARYGVEEFVADNVIILRNVLEGEKRRRTIEILKYRGTNHAKGEFPFTVTSDGGIVALPLSAMELKQHSSNVRITSGNEDLDKMCDGGFFRDSIILISGATGTGKTLMASQFLAASAASNQRALLFAFEESREQFYRNAHGWGFELEKMESEGKIKIIPQYPEVMGLEDHLIVMKQAIEEFKPMRVAVDSLSALERISTTRSFREFVLGLTSHIKHQEIAGLFTSTTPSLLGGTSVTEAHISTITDSIILLRYVEMYGEMRRGLTVLKMRGSMHDKDIREFTIDLKGMHIGKPFRQVTGILSGSPRHTSVNELDALGGLFSDEN
ncbi:MAG TPA: circadian clock protein KaiC [Methylomirabilota bacterium]|nr:circadian clock protein KaiC [Methylomirabilota bacterium]